MTDIADRILDPELSDEEREGILAQLQADNEMLYFNGINGATGSYGVTPMSGTDFANIIEGKTGEKPEPPDNLDELRAKKAQKDVLNAAPIKPPNDPTKLSDAGWAVIFAAKDPNVPAIRESLKELLDLRKTQAGDRFKIYDGPNGYKPNETKAKFCERHKVGDGPADPEQMPYYVLIVGSPEDIPYRFQYQLDVMRGVGRIYFETLQEYANYAHSVVMAETGQVKLPRRAAFFGVANPDDKATQLSSKYLVNPMYEKMKKLQPFTKWVGDGAQRTKLDLDWQCEAYLGEAAKKAQLAHLLGGTQTPALLFTASHGMEFPLNDLRQLKQQGAFLCQDWPGPTAWRGEIGQDFYFAGDDIGDDANLLGLIAFHFACFGAGTPKLDEFAKQAGKKSRATIAPKNFLAGLPTRLLGHPKGGALAVIGHVERAWGYSFLSPSASAQNGAFESTLRLLLSGDPVGWTTESFNLRYADLASTLTEAIENLEYGEPNPYDIAGTWTSHNDARGYVVLGDPAVRIPFAPPGTEPDATRPAAQVKPIVITAPTVAAPASAATSEVSSESVASQQTAAFDMIAFSVQVQEERTSLTDSIKKFTSELADSLKRAADDISSLEVITYSTDDLNQVTYDYNDKKLHGELKMRALTRIAFDGDVQVCVPEKDGHIDQAVWDVHLSMVKAAQENRAAFLATMAELATKLIGMLGGK
jgi:hypothetical protein